MPSGHGGNGDDYIQSQDTTLPCTVRILVYVSDISASKCVLWYCITSPGYRKFSLLLVLLRSLVDTYGRVKKYSLHAETSSPTTPSSHVVAPVGSVSNVECF